MPAPQRQSRSERAPSCALSKQPTRAETQHKDEHHKDADLTERLAEIEPRQTLDHTNEQPTDHRARDRAHTAENDDREGDQNKSISGVRVNVVGRNQKAGCHSETS